MKTKLSILMVFLVPVLVLGLTLASMLVPTQRVFAANTAQATCSDQSKTGNTRLSGDRLDACIAGYNGGYSNRTVDQACGTPQKPLGKITYGTGGTIAVCEAGVKLGVQQKKADGVTSKPSEEDIKDRTKSFCDTKFKSTDTNKGCEEGYKEANKTGATAASLGTFCNRQPNALSKEACTIGAEKAGLDDVEVNTGARASTSAASSTGSTTNENQVDCDASGVNLSWIICPIIDIGAGLSDFVFQDIVTPLMVDVPVSADPNNGTYKAWTSFRVLANVFLVGSLLVIVYSQAKGGK